MRFLGLTGRFRHLKGKISKNMWHAYIEAELDELRACYDSTAVRIARLEAGGNAGAPVPAENQPQADQSMKLTIEIAPGELIDRLSILEIKLERIQDAAKLNNVRHEYEITMVERRKLGNLNPELEQLAAALKEANERIWDVEDNLRDLDRASTFDDKFIAFARSAYQTNDRRAEIKRRINELLKSEILEEKSHVRAK
jgi:hypothetical protein